MAWVEVKCETGLGGRFRTCGLVFPKHARCLLRHTEKMLVPADGNDPSTSALSRRRSATELREIRLKSWLPDVASNHGFLVNSQALCQLRYRRSGLDSRLGWHRTTGSNREPSALESNPRVTGPLCDAAAKPNPGVLSQLDEHDETEIHFGCAQPRASRRMWCLASRDLAKRRAHPGPPTPCRVASECMDTPEVERMTSLELAASAMAWPRSAY